MTNAATPLFTARMTSIDGASKKATFKTIAGLAAFIEKWAGRSCIEGNTAISSDGIGKVVFNGATAEQILAVLDGTAEKAHRAARQPVKALNKSAADIQANAAAEKARKAASKKALRLARQAEEAAARAAETGSDQAIEEAHRLAMSAADHRAEDAANALATAIADAEATGSKLEDMLESMGIDANGYPVAPVTGSRAKYDGPMLALRAAAKSYITPANGNQCCGDALATECGAYTREVVVKGLISALGLESNPYAHLNPGQQSMNLRNKARAKLTAGMLTMAEVKTALNVAYILSPEFAAVQAEARKAA